MKRYFKRNPGSAGTTNSVLIYFDEDGTHFDIDVVGNSKRATKLAVYTLAEATNFVRRGLWRELTQDQANAEYRALIQAANTDRPASTVDHW